MRKERKVYSGSGDPIYFQFTCYMSYNMILNIDVKYLLLCLYLIDVLSLFSELILSQILCFIPPIF